MTTEDSPFYKSKVVCPNHNKVVIPKSWILLSPQLTYVETRNCSHTSGNQSIYLHYIVMLESFYDPERRPEWLWYSVVLPGWYWYILSRYNLQKRHKITYNSTDGIGFTVHKAESTNHVFAPSKKGLFFSDVNCDIVLIYTVDSIKIKYTVKVYSDAVKPGPYRTS